MEKDQKKKELYKKFKIFLSDVLIITIIYLLVYIVLTIGAYEIHIFKENYFLRSLFTISLLTFVYDNIDSFDKMTIYKSLVSLTLLVLIFSKFNIDENKILSIIK